MPAKTPSNQPPPYSSYKTFGTFLERLGPDLPNRVDRSVLGHMSGANQYQLLAALRYLRLVSQAGVVTERLRDLVKADGASRQDILRRLITEAYPFLFEGFDLKRATMHEIEVRFAAAGASGDTIRRCVSFFLGVARDCGIQLSPFLEQARQRRKNVRKQTTMGVEQVQGVTVEQMLIAKLPEFDASWPPEIKMRWFEIFERLTNGLEEPKQLPAPRRGVQGSSKR
jgi:hypothetical protein